MVTKPKQSILSRSIHIKLGRKPDGVEMEPLPDDLYEQLEPMRRDLATIALACAEQVGAYQTNLLNNRARDNWRNLLAIASLAGPQWEQATEATAIRMETAQGGGRGDYRRYLISSLGVFFKHRRISLQIPPGERFFVKTDDILNHREGLNGDKEAPWQDEKPGRLTTTKLAHELAEYEVKSTPQGKGKGNQARGYWSDQIERIVSQYAPKRFQPVNPST